MEQVAGLTASVGSEHPLVRRRRKGRKEGRGRKEDRNAEQRTYSADALSCQLWKASQDGPEKETSPKDASLAMLQQDTVKSRRADRAGNAREASLLKCSMLT
jgi:hypothetical protein